MKIAFINHSFILGSGIDTVIYELARHLAYNHKVTVFTFYNKYEEQLNFEVKEVEIPFKESRMVRSVLSPIFLHKVVHIRKSIQDYDVVNTHLYPANLIPLIPNKLKKPFNIVTEWSEPGVNPNYEFTQKLYKQFVRKMNEYAAKKADSVIAPCNFTKKWIEKEYGIIPIKMYLDGINFEILDMKRSYNTLDFLENSPVILYVGRIDPYKNIDLLIKSFEIVKRRIYNAKLVIVGHIHFTNYFKKLKELVAKKNLGDDVLFTGVVSWDDLAQYYASCDVYATCSSWEGFLRAEAFAMGKPMVAFDVGANSDTIKNGENGLLVSKQTSEAFADALISLLTDESLRNKMGRKGYDWAKKNLDFNLIAKKFSDFAENRLM